MFKKTSQQFVSQAPGRELRLLLPDMRDVFTLGAMAVITGAFLALALGVIAAYLKYAQPVKLGLASWAIFQALIWLLLLVRWSKLLNLLERSLGIDINQDGLIAGEKPEPERTLEPVRIELGEVNNGARAMHFVELPATQEQVISLACGLMSGASFSESAWTGSGAPFSKNEFIRLRDEMLRRNLLQWRNERAPAQGLELSRAGKATMRYFASMAQQERLQ